MTREEQCRQLWCDVYTRIREQRNSNSDAKLYADVAVDSFNASFPPPKPDTRFDRLVDWIRTISHRDGGELIINAHEFDRAVRSGS